MKFNKKFAWLLIVIAFLFINIIPDPTDIITLQIYSAFTGADVSPSNLSCVYIDFVKWSLIVGLCFLLAGMWILKLNFKKLFKKMDLGKYRVAVLLSIGVVIAMTFCKIDNYLYLLVLPIIYYFYEKDFSESLALGLSSFTLLLFGFGELLTFILNRAPIPEVIEIENLVVSWISITLGFPAITNISLIISVIIGFIVVFCMTKVLKEKF